jgi:hypothetical protein
MSAVFLGEYALYAKSQYEIFEGIAQDAQAQYLTSAKWYYWLKKKGGADHW